MTTSRNLPVTRSSRFSKRPILVGLSALFVVTFASAGWAQSVVTAVNGEPITSYDVEQHAKLLRLAHRPSSNKDALEDAIAERLKYIEARRNGVDASDSDMQTALGRLAAEGKMQPQAWLNAAQAAKVDTDTLRNYLRSMGAWNAYVRNRNKMLDVSEADISAQLARQGSNAKITDYDLREVVFILPVNASPALAEGRMKEAQSLRNRFSDCESGLPLARVLPDVAIKQRLSKASDTLPEDTRALLAETPRGRLTPPRRSPTGIEMVAVCNKMEDSDPTTLRERIQKDLLVDKLKAVSDEMYRQVRATAVIGKE